MDDKFGAELVTKKGKVFKFDDIKCMTMFKVSDEGKANEYSFEIVMDYAHVADEFDLVPVKDAFYLESPEVKSPMAGNVAAFKSKAEAENFQKKWNATPLTWDQVLTHFK
jgi:copper chaperone NosL